jgi:hypothetical protein
MDIVYLVLALAAGLLLPRPRAVLATAVAWAVCVAFVGWGPAHNSDVHTDSLGFWGPWLIAGIVGLALAAGVSTLRARRRNATG